MPVASVIPPARHPREADFQIILWLPRPKNGDASALPHPPVQVFGKLAITGEAHVATKVELTGIAAAVHRARAVYHKDRVGQALALLSDRDSAAQLHADAVAGKNRSRQRGVGKFVQPARAALTISSQRQQHVA